MNYNLHTHTARCHHATGTPEEYVLRAIEGGITHMGFSDHFPFVRPDGQESIHRVPMAEVGEYASDVQTLKEKYKDKIHIKFGFEMEYYPDQFAEMLESARAYGAEYLICGQHFLSTDEEKQSFATTKPTDSAERLITYVSLVTQAIKTGVFTYIAHPDILRFTGDTALYQREMRRICLAARDENVPLEINFLGIRSGRNYPNELFWELAGETGAPVTFGFDAHSTDDAFDTASLVKAEALVKKYSLHYIGMPALRLP
jgi:histidinol-phosphatase (PHP family)